MDSLLATHKNELLALYSNVYGYCYKLCNNKQDAEDLTQTVYMKAFASGLKNTVSLYSWMCTIANNEFINNYRRKNRYFKISGYLTEDHPSICYQPANIEKDLIYSNLEKLDHRKITALKMRIEGYSYKEVAETMNEKIGTLKSLIFSARKQLTKMGVDRK